jgi:UDP-N-acetylmuramate--alanine ligase
MHSHPLKIFFSGIGGSGMSAIATFMADRGNSITGSDRAFDSDPGHQLCTTLRAGGITIVSQDGNGIDDTFNLAVFSTAVESGQPEYRKAKAVGIPVKTRPEYLREITASMNTIAVSGTSGKSTASGMLAFLMEKLSLNPNFIGGGRVKQFQSPGRPGNSLTGSSEHLVFEACESDGSIIYYRPAHTIILNLGLDHHNIHETALMFESLIRNTQQKIFINADDGNLKNPGINESITFSINTPSDYRAERVEYRPFSTVFSVLGQDFSLQLPGRHNLYNALSCIAFLREAGIAPEEISTALSGFQGIDRRFDIILNRGGGLVIDDYAHNPHKISSLMETVQSLRDHVCYIFQPHGFSPTRFMKKEYIETFTHYLRGSDHLIILPIFYAGGTVSKDISSHDLADGVRAGGKSAEVPDMRSDVLASLPDFRSFVIFGARDETLSGFAGEIARVLSGRGQ